VAIFSPLGIGRSALLAHQRALQVTGANVANVNTPGYSRQRAEFESIPAGAGYGVNVDSIERIVDRFLAARSLLQTSAEAGARTERDLLDRIQTFFPVDGKSIGGAMDDFFTAVSALSTRPEDGASRNDVLERATALAGRFNRTAHGIAQLQREIDSRLRDEVAEADSQVVRIAELNRAIKAAEVTGGSANELRDERDRTLEQLGERFEVRGVEHADGTVDVFLASSGAALVLGQDAARLAVQNGPGNGLDGSPLAVVGTLSASGAFITLPGAYGARVGALADLRDTSLPDLSAELDLLATTLRDAVNAVQTAATGRDLDGNVGTALFAGTGAADLSVALTDPRGIAAAQSTDPSDNSNALALVNVQLASQGALGGVTLGEAFGQIQAAVGSAVREASDRAAVEEGVAASLRAQRDSVSGVNLEEEFTDLVRFQRGFQAASQLISVSDRLLEELISVVR
jgi:flagellar hook-associated protein 1 FlgK